MDEVIIVYQQIHPIEVKLFVIISKIYMQTIKKGDKKIEKNFRIT